MAVCFKAQRQLVPARATAKSRRCGCKDALDCLNIPDCSLAVGTYMRMKVSTSLILAAAGAVCGFCPRSGGSRATERPPTTDAGVGAAGGGLRVLYTEVRAVGTGSRQAHIEQLAPQDTNDPPEESWLLTTRRARKTQPPATTDHQSYRAPTTPSKPLRRSPGAWTSVLSRDISKDVETSTSTMTEGYGGAIAASLCAQCNPNDILFDSYSPHDPPSHLTLMCHIDQQGHERLAPTDSNGTEDLVRRVSWTPGEEDTARLSVYFCHPYVSKWNETAGSFEGRKKDKMAPKWLMKQVDKIKEKIKEKFKKRSTSLLSIQEPPSPKPALHRHSVTTTRGYGFTSERRSQQDQPTEQSTTSCQYCKS
ncbi:hypothetical protein M409DRAFT_49285 [Zasmidium cellare ATCC 36951]|uniref:Uncharacterized protein n=1 Tax=Zasmidium cellare ATCC 36951 TaxID=1080233 RepID=A0A6A6D2Z3_ZASCE|nr:uncharacterized protein M409DRAFT_49285 [Zasmidium cellare ATCC 36951]KAF2172750.1 hypothetical protein M409DRAFT_49285 [Zasmidium cellare ATCC 36951]